MDFFDAVEQRFSVRSFKQDPISDETLAKLVDAARKGPSGANKQPLEYVAVNDPDTNQAIFDCLKWAAYIQPKGTPAPGHTPAAYIVCLIRKDYEAAGVVKYDIGAALGTICLGATAMGLSTTWLKSVNFPKLKEILDLPDTVEPDAVIALGVPDEFPQRVDLEPEQEGGEVIKYWRDEDEKHFVPKRNLKTILHMQKYGG
jgi:nitroreductase